MNTEHHVEIDAPADLVWAVYADVERWSAWTPSVKRITALDQPALAVGHRYRIDQPRLPTLVWAVTELEPGTSWTWRQRSPGGETVADHEVVALDGGRTLVRQRLEQRGPLGSLFGRLSRGLTRRYLDLEAQGLKAESEARHRASRASQASRTDRADAPSA